MDFESADALLQGRNHSSRKIGRNTYLQRRDSGDIAVKLHATDVVIYHPNGATTLSTGGWHTMTTRDRINTYAPRGVRMFTEKAVPYLSVSGKTYRFFDGIRIGPRGAVQNPMREPSIKKQDRANEQLNRDIEAYIDGYIDTLVTGQMPVPSNGDCWYCLGLFPETEHEAESHLLGHLEEGYYVPSLMVKAAKAKGYGDPYVVLTYIFGLVVQNEGDTHFDGTKTDTKEVRRLLRWYLRKHLRKNLAPPRMQRA